MHHKEIYIVSIHNGQYYLTITTFSPDSHIYLSISISHIYLYSIYLSFRMPTYLPIVLLAYSLPTYRSTYQRTYHFSFHFAYLHTSLCSTYSSPPQQFYLPCITCQLTFSILVDVFNPCLGITCNHNGKCKSNNGVFTCECMASFTGTLCENGEDDNTCLFYRTLK